MGKGDLKWSGVPPRTRLQPRLLPATFIAISSKALTVPCNVLLATMRLCP